MFYCSCQNAMNYFIPGARRNNFVSTSDVLNTHSNVNIQLKQQSEDLQFYTAYFKYCEYIFGILCVLSAAIFNLWNAIEGNIVDNFTSEFRQHVLTDASGKSDGEDLRKRHMEYFKKFFIQYKHFRWYGAKYLFIYVVAIISKIIYIIIFATIIFDNYSDLFNLHAYTNVVKLSFKDDLQQLRTDRLAVLFPTFFSCLIPLTGSSGSTFNGTVTCTSMTNTLASKIHVFSIIFCWCMLIALIIDCLWLLFSMWCLPHAKSSGNKEVNQYLSDFTIGKRILFMLFEKNVDAIFWEELLQDLFSTDKKKDEEKVNTKTIKTAPIKRRTIVQIENSDMDFEIVTK